MGREAETVKDAFEQGYRLGKVEGRIDAALDKARETHEKSKGLMSRRERE